MKILAFDTTNSTLSVAIVDDKKLVAARNIFEQNQHSTMLIPLMEECLREAGIWYEDLNAVAFTNGPGSFTGIRVGYSAAKALGIATNLPIIAVGALEVIAYRYLNENKKILVVNDASLGELFVQEFDIIDNQLKPVFEPILIKMEEIGEFMPKGNFILAGSAKKLIKIDLNNAIIFDQDDFIDAGNLALIAEEKYQKGEQTSSEVLYIRKPRISTRKGSGVVS